MHSRPCRSALLSPLLACLLGLAAPWAAASAPTQGIFLIEDEDAGIRLSDHAAGPGARLLIEAEPTPAGRAPGSDTTASSPAPARRYADLVRTAASTHRVAPELLHAVIATESGYAPRAVSPRGALGLMQLMPATARLYGVTDPFDARQNINAGAQHLRRLLDQFGQDMTLALAAYNAGAGAVLRHRHRIPPFAETAAYVPRVLTQLARLQAAPLP